MTSERRLLIGFEDIRAIVLECARCTGRVSFAPDKVDQTRWSSCPNCGRPWLSSTMQPGQFYKSDVLMFLAIVRDLAKNAPGAVNNEADSNVRIFLEFDDDARK